jgi:aryl-alcohol dehydrogenase-like predicted oxidoreductase
MDFLRSAMSPIGFGAFKIGRNQGIKYPQGYDLPDDTAVERLLNGVLDIGVTYLDTAPAYGISEERIGRFLSQRGGEFVLSTKVGEQFEHGVSTYDFSAGGVRGSIERSLRRLRRDVLDLVFIHAPQNDAEILSTTDAVAALLRARDEGLVRAVGFSGYTAPAFDLAKTWADALMVEYHQAHRETGAIIAEAAARGTCIVVKKGLQSGRADGTTAVEFVLGNSGVTSMVIGSLNLDHMHENVRAARRVRSWTGSFNP